MIFHCCEEVRMEAVKEAGVLNGIEYLEVSDREAPSQLLRQRTLYVRLLKPPGPNLTASTVSIAGGERVPSVDVEWIAPATALPAGEDPGLVAGIDDPATMLLVRTTARGDFSTYTLEISTDGTALAGFDPLLNEIEFSFKVECDSDFDCKVDHICPTEKAPAPPIDYLTKDFASFRQLMLDRISLLSPGWTERNPADIGVTLVETLAYIADELSYRQDAIATEAYLATARRRASLRRHARLVDYVVHEGCNARAWVRIEVDGEGVAVPGGTRLLTRIEGLPSIMVPQSRDHLAALAAGAETFETVEPAVLYASHAAFDFWTWGDDECCLPKGATSATLVGHHPELKAGDVLVLSEVLGPTTGRPNDADPGKRAAVRLTDVVSTADPSAGLFDEPPTNAALDVTQISWDELDALPFPLCVSTQHVPGAAISRAWGNIVLADHGRTISGEDLGTVPESVLDVATVSASHCADRSEREVPARFRPVLEEAPLTHVHAAPWKQLAQGPAGAGVEAELNASTVGPVLTEWLTSRNVSIDGISATVRGGDGVWSVVDGDDQITLRLDSGLLTAFDRPPAATGTRQRIVREARPSIALIEDPSGARRAWKPQLDLLAADRDAREFVVEADHDQRASIRFGNGTHGRRPDAGTAFEVDYRVGNGVAGNVGANAIAHVVTSQTDLRGCTNPLAADGGTDPESADAIRRDAPEAFTVQQRAVTARDYATMTEQKTEVQRAEATFRWTGSWNTVFVTADRVGGKGIDPTFENDVRRHLEPFRMAGYDLEVDQPRFVPLEIALRVCVHPDHFRPDVEDAVLQRLAGGLRRDGTKGFFHPDRLTFGQPVYLSAIVAEVQGVQGVTSVGVDTFQRRRDPGSDGTDGGALTMGRLEIAQLSNDPNFPERGVLTLTMEGGK